MKRFLLAFCCLLAGCSSTRKASEMENWAAQNGKVKILSTTAMIDDIVGQIGGDRVDHIALITGEIDPHSYELVKGDDEKLTMAQVIFYNGLGLEHGASLRYQLEHHKNALGVGNVILKQHPEWILHVDKEIDPHIWMDIALWAEIVRPIVDALSALDPQGKELYAKNGAILEERMSQEHQEVFRELQNIPESKRYLVTSHDAFNYFTRAYLAQPNEENWKVRFDAPEGLAPEGQLSAADIQKVIDHLILYHIQVVFPESNVSRDSLKKVVHACAQKGLQVRISSDPLYGDAMGAPGSDADTYLKMIRHDANVLYKAWE
ncbi:MAG: zinc ABC transporter substrate-binding protein [Candidatus Melainabacteria bacterium]|nr:zinc ABC transporter substrate-binding protein [Candidatus Melainabacteria bacterium]